VKLTPMDVRKQSFRKTMRGFDPEDVRVFLDMVAEEYENLLQQNGMMGEKNRHLTEQLNRYYGMEKTLQNSLLTAERLSEEARERSRLEADTVLEDARLRAERILGDSRERLRILAREIQELQRQKDLFIQRLQSFLQAQSDMLAARRDDLNVIDELGVRADELRMEAGQSASDASEIEAPLEESTISPRGPALRRLAKERPELVPEPAELESEDEEPEGVLPAESLFAGGRQQASFFELGAEGGTKR
jgi:cell division initiation protein